MQALAYIALLWAQRMTARGGGSVAAWAAAAVGSACTAIAEVCHRPLVALIDERVALYARKSWGPEVDERIARLENDTDARMEQLEARLEEVEKDSEQFKREHRIEYDRMEAKLQEVEKEQRMLSARMGANEAPKLHKNYAKYILN